MPPTPDAAIRFHAVIVSNSGRVSLRWSEALATAGAAAARGKAQVEAGTATLAFIVRVEDGMRRALPSGVYPMSARKIVRHWLDLVGECEGKS